MVDPSKLTDQQKREIEDSYKQRWRGDTAFRWAKKDIKLLKVDDDTQQAIDQAIAQLNTESTRKPVEHEQSFPRCDCGHLFEICNAPNCERGQHD